MDTQRWKSVLVPRDVYEEIKDLAQKDGRTISGQLRDLKRTSRGLTSNIDMEQENRRINL